MSPLSVFGQTPVPEPVPRQEQGFRWNEAVLQSAWFLAIQHGYRLTTEADTRSTLKGPFVRDYLRSVAALRGWSDGDDWVTNYVGHPFQGAITGYIGLQNDPKYMYAQFGKSGLYWKGRLRAAAWSAAYSAQFEAGPLGEAAIGNIALTPGRAGFVDWITTPVGGFGLMVTEDAVDRFVISKLEARTTNRVSRLLLRSVLNPNRSVANALRGKVPWHRDTRPGVSK